MRKFKSPHLGIFFIIAVIIPSIILSLIAVRAINHEEAYIEKRLEGTLMAEVIQVVSLVNMVLKDMQEELTNTLQIPTDNNFAQTFAKWKEKSNLVDIPFMLSSTNEILWPDLNSNLSKEEISFINFNKDFFSDKKEIPVYQNIAVVYKDAIINEIKKMRETQKLVKREKSEERFLEKASPSVPFKSFEPSGLPSEGEDVAQNQVFLFSDKDSHSNIGGEKKSTGEVGQTIDKIDTYTQLQMSKYTESQFAQHPSIRERVYKEARKKGKQVFVRNVILQQKLSEKVNKQKEEFKEQKSLYVSEPLKFSEIIANKDSGIIPRFINDKLNLLFWKKDEKNGGIIGCVINQRGFRERILSVLPEIYSSVRILTILDENGIPLVTPDDGKTRDWRRPFVAREISELLPRWEIAAYLTDPHIVSAKAQFIGWVMCTLIFILFISIITGGVLILRSLHSEITLAQQKTTFVANVSHELKTPLTSIRMFAEMLKEKRQPDEEKQRKYFNIMVSETERLTRLINNVLDFSRMEQGKKRYNMKKINIVSLCREIVEHHRERLEQNGFTVNFTTNIERLTIYADEEALKQVMLNLLSNAEKYSPDEKKIDVEISKEEKFVFIEIKDRGIGIPERESKKIFKEFYRVDDALTSKVRGTGLGLTIARKIIQDNGGDILYFPHYGGGSIFQIKLPIFEKE
ncbi:MAG: hypothetical protein B6D56_07080 [Candidatus Omnitrophica bacterium 4484_70.1]|nr:MAG: hypothetical protein B6D56_07080 [Candidatus Omnitrophica bacterium 4484_70.1]